jgi:hypothetical protein
MEQRYVGHGAPSGGGQGFYHGIETSSTACASSSHGACAISYCGLLDAHVLPGPPCQRCRCSPTSSKGVGRTVGTSLRGVQGTVGDRGRQGQHAALAITRAPSHGHGHGHGLGREKWVEHLQSPKMLSRSALRNCPVVARCASMADLCSRDQPGPKQGDMIHPISTSTSFVNAPVGHKPAHPMCGIACAASSSDMRNNQTLGLPKTCGSSVSHVDEPTKPLCISLALFLGHFLQ